MIWLMRPALLINIIIFLKVFILKDKTMHRLDKFSNIREISL